MIVGMPRHKSVVGFLASRSRSESEVVGLTW